jgi:hypothetical protein
MNAPKGILSAALFLNVACNNGRPEVLDCMDGSTIQVGEECPGGEVVDTVPTSESEGPENCGDLVLELDNVGNRLDLFLTDNSGQASTPDSITVEIFALDGLSKLTVQSSSSDLSYLEDEDALQCTVPTWGDSFKGFPSVVKGHPVHDHYGQDATVSTTARWGDTECVLEDEILRMEQISSEVDGFNISNQLSVVDLDTLASGLDGVDLPYFTELAGGPGAESNLAVTYDALGLVHDLFTVGPEEIKEAGEQTSDGIELAHVQYKDGDAYFTPETYGFDQYPKNLFFMNAEGEVSSTGIVPEDTPHHSFVLDPNSVEDDIANFFLGYVEAGGTMEDTGALKRISEGGSEELIFGADDFSKDCTYLNRFVLNEPLSNGNEYFSGTCSDNEEGHNTSNAWFAKNENGEVNPVAMIINDGRSDTVADDFTGIVLEAPNREGEQEGEAAIRFIHDAHLTDSGVIIYDLNVNRTEQNTDGGVVESGPMDPIIVSFFEFTDESGQRTDSISDASSLERTCEIPLALEGDFVEESSFTDRQRGSLAPVPNSDLMLALDQDGKTWVLSREQCSVVAVLHSEKEENTDQNNNNQNDNNDGEMGFDSQIRSKWLDRTSASSLTGRDSSASIDVSGKTSFLYSLNVN